MPSEPTLSRRRFLAAAAGSALALGAGIDSAGAQAAPRPAKRVLIDDVVQDATAFARGQRSGPSLQAGALQGSGAFESEVIAAPFAFTHVGLHYRGLGRLADLAFELRTSRNGSDWTDWQPTFVEASGDDTPVGDTFAALVGAARHRHVQYRTDLAGSAALSRVTTTFINSTDGPDVQAAALTEQPHNAVDRTRSSWGADESLRFSGSDEIWRRMFLPVKKLVVHHTASGAFADSAAEVRAIYAYHAQTLGWGDIGYNFLIGPIFGAGGVVTGWETFEGRYGEENGALRPVFNPQVVAGHALGHNYGTCGVAVLGNFETTPLPAGPYKEGGMLDVLLDLLQAIARVWRVDPLVTSPFLQSSGTWTAALANVCGHRDCTATACPGQYLYPAMATLRTRLNNRLNRSASVAINGPDGITTAVRNHTYSWPIPIGKAASFALEGWSKEPTSEDVTLLRGVEDDGAVKWQPWSTSVSQRTFSNLPDGHYTLHVRVGTPNASGGYAISHHEANKTIYIDG